MKLTGMGPTLVVGVFALVAPSLAAARAAPPPAFDSAQDRSFLTRAIMADDAQIRLGQMAEKRGPAINDFGVLLVQERNRDRDQSIQLAKAEGMAPPDGASPRAMRERARLEQLSGPQFNLAFVKYMIAADRRAITAYRREARGRGPVAEHARSTIPSLQKQLQIAIGLAQQAGA